MTEEKAINELWELSRRIAIKAKDKRTDARTLARITIDTARLILAELEQDAKLRKCEAMR